MPGGDFLALIPPRTEALTQYLLDLAGIALFEKFLDDIVRKADLAGNLFISLSQQEGILRDEMIARGMDPDKGVAEYRAPAHELEDHRLIRAQMYFCRFIDSYLKYLSDILFLAFKTRPEMLRSNEKLTCEKVLSYNSRDELIHGLAEDKIQRVAYGGFREISKTMERYGLPLFETESQFRSGVFLVEVRNVIVHNRGRVNKTFIERTGLVDAAVGNLIDLTEEHCRTARNFLSTSAFYVDAKAIAKFGLPIS